jgi:hypothetical protein
MYGEVRKAMMTMELVTDMNAQAQGGPNVPATLVRAAANACEIMHAREGQSDYEEKRIAYVKAFNRHELYCRLWCSNRSLVSMLIFCIKAAMKVATWKNWQRLGLVPREYKVDFSAIPLPPAEPAASSSIA